MTTTEAVEVNLNAVTRDGMIRAHSVDFPQPLLPGDIVTITDPDDEVAGTARVDRVSGRTGLVYLDVNWDTLRDAP